MSSNPIADRAMLTAISRQDMDGLVRALADGANANKTIKVNSWDGNTNPMGVAVKHGWIQAFGVLAKAGGKRRPPAGKSAVSGLAAQVNARGIQEMVRVSGKLTGTEMVEALDALREPKIEDETEEARHRVEQTFRSLLEALPDKLSARERVGCAQSMISSVNLSFQLAMGPRRAFPLEWMKDLAAALPGSRRLVGGNTPGLGDALQDFTLVVCAAVNNKLPDIDERLDLAGKAFAIDLGSVLEIRYQFTDIAGSDAKALEAAHARQQGAMLGAQVSPASPGTPARPRM